MEAVSIDAREARELRRREESANFVSVGIRWYGPADAAMRTTGVFGAGDPISLREIGYTIGVSGIVTALHGKRFDEVWKVDELEMLNAQVEQHGLRILAIESLYVSDQIKLGRPGWERLADIWGESAMNIGRVIKNPIITYHGMIGMDWTRTPFEPGAPWTDLYWPLPDGSLGLGYSPAAASAFDPATQTIDLPAWATSYTPEEFSALRDAARGLGARGIRDNVARFLAHVAPAVESAGATLALHPDDPPTEIWGIPRAFGDEAGLGEILDAVDEPWNCLCLCTGSLSSRPDNDLPGMIRRFGSRDRIAWAHVRSVDLRSDGSFQEVRHTGGTTPVMESLKALHDIGFRGPIRPDHGRMLPGMNDHGRPGYTYHDRVLQAAPYLYGVTSAIAAHSGTVDSGRH